MPFLVADPQSADDVDHYIIELDGELIAHDPERDDANNQVRLHYDVTGVALGAHIVRVKAGNMWGESDFSSPFEFTKKLPAGPSGISLEI